MKLNRKLLIGAALTAAFSAAVWAQSGPMGPGYGMGQGMMGGYGPGYGMGPGVMGGYGPGHGMGPGTMGGYGPGCGMGSGMMGGYGPGHGMGPGWGGGWGLATLNLSDAQRAKIAEIQREVATKHWALMGKVHEQQYQLFELDESGKADDTAARKAYDNMTEAHKQMFETRLDARKRIESVLTPEQRKQLRRGGAESR